MNRWFRHLRWVDILVFAVWTIIAIHIAAAVVLFLIVYLAGLTL
jgi:hypothetical protein